ncbi:MAG: tRNA pseudouridine(55) synthase TruB [Proteobacteria bacterium]|nr:tRNA pseudouridine(55) synthase TruB [Pseudomonadota bacterium]
MIQLCGVIPVFKPTGLTSKDVSRVLQKRFGKMKIGHVGTLDPDADGVLPVLIGSATKLQDYLLAMPKRYRFVIKLGHFTSTQDASGVVLETKTFSHVSKELILSKLEYFKGKISQIPPLYSAVKLDGKELYKHARGGKSELTTDQAARLTREVTIHNFELVDFKLDAIEMTVDCSKGTYVRTLALDLLSKMDTAGHVTSIRREQSAGFSLNQCHALSKLEAPNTELADFLIHPDLVSIGLPIWRAPDCQVGLRIRDGQRVALSLGDFATGVKYEPLLCSYECEKLFLIQSSSGSNIGIATVLRNNEQLTIHLKRGL